MSKLPPLTQKQMISQLIRRNEAGKSIRAQRWEPLWNDVMQFLWPQAGSMYANSAFMPGEMRGARCFDGTPEDALDIMCAGMQTATIPENYPWFSWEAVPRWLNQHKAVRQWLDACRDITLEYLSSSNFASATYTTWKHLGAWGTACKFRQKANKEGKFFTFNTLRLTDCVFWENHEGLVDTLFWEFKISARNAVARWGDDAPGGCKRAVESGNHDAESSYLQCIFPRDDYDRAKLDNKNMPYASWIIDVRKQSLIEESGFKIFPASVPRWDKLDDTAFSGAAQLQGGVYGRGPGIKILQDLETLNQQAKSNLLATQLMVQPAWDIPSDGYEEELEFSPNARNYYNPTSTHGVRVSPIGQPTGLPISLQVQQEQRKIIQQGFHTDVFLMFQNTPPGMTATEATIRNQEKMVVLEPMTTRQKVEHLERDLDWAFSVLDDMGMFPPAPDILFLGGAQSIKTIFKSPLFAAQEQRRSQLVLGAYQKAAMIAQARQGKSDVMAMLNDEQALKVILRADGVPAEIIQDEEQFRKIQASMVQQRKQMVAEQQMMALAKGARMLGKIPTGDEDHNAANDLIKQLGGGQGGGSEAQGAQA